MTETTNNTKIEEIKAILNEYNTNKKPAGEGKSKTPVENYLNNIKIDFVYNSLIMSGFDMSYQEAVSFMENDTLSKNLTLNEYLIIRNYHKLVNHIFNKKLKSVKLTKELICDLHLYLTKGVSEMKTGDGKGTVKITHGKFKDEKTEKEIDALIKWFNDENEKKENIENLITLYVKIILIKPFTYGSSVIAFLILNLFFIKFGLIPMIITEDLHDDYYESFIKAKNGDYFYIKDFIIKNIEENVKNCINNKTPEEINGKEELKKRIEEFHKKLSSKLLNQKNNQETNENLNENEIKESITELCNHIEELGTEVFNNRDDSDFEWNIKSPVRIDDLPIANTAVIVEYFDTIDADIQNTLVGTTYLDSIKKGSSVLISIIPKKNYVPKSSVAFCILQTPKELYLTGSISVAHLENGEDRLVPNEKSRVFSLKGSKNIAKWSYERIEDFFATIVNTFLSLVETEAENRKASFNFIN